MAGRTMIRSYGPKIPKPELIKNLHHLYYVLNASPNEHISSHWNEYSRNLRFQLGGDGFPVDISGFGFGDFETRNPLYQVLCYFGMGSYLAILPVRLHLVSILGHARRLCQRMGLTFGQDAFRQVCSLVLIWRHLSPVQHTKQLTILMIGDGYGFLASLFKDIFPKSTIVLVDLGKILLFQAYYCQKAHPDKVHQSILDEGKLDVSNSDFVYCPAEFLDRISRFKYDIAVNIASMQEMTKESLVGYFEFLRWHMETNGLFYCCNRERKVLSGGEIVEFDEYPWHPDDVHLVDERCPWHSYYVSFTTTANGPRVLGMRVPFLNYYDGPTWHRLSRLYQEQ